MKIILKFSISGLNIRDTKKNTGVLIRSAIAGRYRSCCSGKKRCAEFLPHRWRKNQFVSRCPHLWMGLCLVVSPLIALMKTRLKTFPAKVIPAPVYSGMSYHEVKQTPQNAAFGNYKFLYVRRKRRKQFVLEFLPALAFTGRCWWSSLQFVMGFQITPFTDCCFTGRKGHKVPCDRINGFCYCWMCSMIFVKNWILERDSVRFAAIFARPNLSAVFSACFQTG